MPSWSENQLRALRSSQRAPASSGQNAHQQGGTRAPGGGGGGGGNPPERPVVPPPDTFGQIRQWVVVTGTTQAMEPGIGYLTMNGALTTLTLPATCDQFDVMAVLGSGAGMWKIAQNAGQSLWFSRRQTTVGTGGSLAARHSHDAVYLRCITADTTFEAAFEV